MTLLSSNLSYTVFNAHMNWIVNILMTLFSRTALLICHCDEQFKRNDLVMGMAYIYLEIK